MEVRTDNKGKTEMKTAAEKALTAKSPAPGRHSDGRNLYLRVSPTGVRSWSFLWKPANRTTQREMGLGSTALVSLIEAREEAMKIHRQIRDGIDPIAARRVTVLNEKTFAEMMLEFIAVERVTWKLKPGETVSKNEREFHREFRSYCADLVGKWNEEAGEYERSRCIVDITEETIAGVLEPIWKTINRTANAIHIRIKKILQRAVDQKIVPTNVADFNAAGRFGKLAKGKTVGHAAAGIDEMPVIFGLCQSQPDQMAAQGLALLMLTLVRTDAALNARWSNIDLDAAIWTVPEENNKHDNADQKDGSLVVPLSKAAVDLLRSLPRNGDVVFWRDNGLPLGISALLDKLVKPAPAHFGYKGRATPHGFRATFKTWTIEEHLDREAAELCLGHDLPGASNTEKAYSRGAMLKRRRDLLEKWALVVCPPKQKLKLVA